MSKTTDRAPCVVFISHSEFTSFAQTSVRLHRLGVHTVHITIGPARLVGRARAATHYDAVIRGRDLDTEFLRAAMTTIAAEHRVVDVVTCESVLEPLDWLAPGVLEPDVLDRVRTRAMFADKRVCSQRLAQAGVPVPQIVPPDAEVGAGRLVVKLPRSAGGVGVRVVDGMPQAHRAIDQLRAQAFAKPLSGSGEPMIERFIEGQIIRYGVVYAEGAPLAECQYFMCRMRSDSLGLATAMRTIDHPAMREIGRCIVHTIGGSGVANIEAVLDANGTPYVIDVNLRPWHSIVAMLDAGVDFVAAYLAALTGSPRSEGWGTCLADRLVNMFPIEPAQLPSVRWSVVAGTLVQGWPRGVRRIGLLPTATDSLAIVRQAQWLRRHPSDLS